MTIDGALDEWKAAQPLAINTREQVLRGAAAWPGPETETIDLRWMWDEENLYVAAHVKDPKHLQQEIGPMVWRGDVLYLYLDTKGNRDRLDVKLTLAQTPQGPQVWSWMAQSFLPGAQLAWQPTEDGYIYEAALPLKSLDFLKPGPGKRMNFDAGMGFTGGFINWTGLDPDTVDNLAPLDLVEELSPVARAGEAQEQLPDDVAFSVALDREPEAPVVVPQAVAPDRDYLWLEPVFEEPIWLDRSAHRLLVEYAGRQPDREAIVDAFLIHPANLCKRFEHPDGRQLTLCYDAQTGISTWEETQ